MLIESRLRLGIQVYLKSNTKGERIGTFPQSYYYFMHEHLFKYVNIREEATFVPDGTNPDEAALSKAPIK